MIQIGAFKPNQGSFEKARARASLAPTTQTKDYCGNQEYFLLSGLSQGQGQALPYVADEEYFLLSGLSQGQGQALLRWRFE